MSEALRRDAQIEDPTSAIQRHARKLLFVAGAGGAAAITFGAGGHTAHAEEIVDPNAGTIILTEKGDTVWDGQAKLGLTPEERIADLEAHGYETYEEQSGLDQGIGKTWTVDPEVIALKQQRELRIAVEKQTSQPIKTPPSKKPEQHAKPELDPNTLYFVLKPGETVWSDLTKAGVAPENIDECLEYIKQSYDSAYGAKIDFNNLPVGFRYSIPLSYKIGFPKVVNAPTQQQQAPQQEVAPPKPTQPKPSNTPPSPAKPQPEAQKPAPTPPVQVTPPEKIAPAPQPPAAPKPNEVAPTPPPEKIKEPQTIAEVLQEMREQYATGKAEIAPMVAFIQKNFKHPEINPANGITKDNVNQLFVLPEPQTGFDFIVNPLTCENQAITSAVMLGAMIVTQDYAHWLTETRPEFAYLIGKFRIQFGDMNDGQHRTHQLAGAIDLRSSFINNPGELIPDGPLFMSNAKGFDLAFNEAVFPFMNNLKVMNQKIFRQLLTSSKKLERNLTGRNEPGDYVAGVSMHGDHTHVDIYESLEILSFFSPAQPLDCNHPATGGHTEYEQPAPEITTPPTTTDAPQPPETSTPPTETTPPPETTTETTVAQETVSIDSLLSDAAKNYQVQNAQTAYDLSVQSVNNGGELSFNESYGPQIEIRDVYIYLRQAGATHEEAALLTAISMRETGLRPGSVGDVFHTSKSGRKQPSYGLFQVMDIDGSGGARDPQANLDPQKAAVNALSIARSGGYGPWESFMPETINKMTLVDAVDLSHRDMKTKQRQQIQERITDNVSDLLDVLEVLRPQVDKALQQG